MRVSVETRLLHCQASARPQGRCCVGEFMPQPLEAEVKASASQYSPQQSAFTQWPRGVCMSISLSLSSAICATRLLFLDDPNRKASLVFIHRTRLLQSRGITSRLKGLLRSVFKRVWKSLPQGAAPFQHLYRSAERIKTLVSQDHRRAEVGRAASRPALPSKAEQ